MAGIGIYGIFYAKATLTDGSVTGYTGGTKLLGEAIDASFEPNQSEGNPLYANNRVQENDTSGASGGTLTHTTSRLKLEAVADIYGLELKTVQVTVEGQTEPVTGTGISYTGEETAATVGAAYIRMNQENGVRSHEVVLFRGVDYKMPAESAQTKGESLEWQTNELEGAVMGRMGNGEPWHDRYVFPTQDAAIAYIYSILGKPEPEAEAAISEAMERLNDGEGAA